MTAYRSKNPLTMVEPEALVIYCSAARYQQHFEEFLVEGLKLENYSLLAIPGGIQVLNLLEYLPKFAWAGWRWTKFLVDADHPRSEEHTSELQSRFDLVCRLLLEKKKRYNRIR